MAILSVQRPSLSGVAISMAAAAGGGDSFANDGSTYFRVANGSGGAVTVTFDAPNACNFGITDNAHDKAVSVGAGVTLEIGPFDKARFNDANNRVQVAYSGVTSVTVAAVAR